MNLCDFQSLFKYPVWTKTNIKGELLPGDRIHPYFARDLFKPIPWASRRRMYFIQNIISLLSLPTSKTIFMRHLPHISLIFLNLLSNVRNTLFNFPLYICVEEYFISLMSRALKPMQSPKFSHFSYCNPVSNLLDNCHIF